MLIIRLIPVSHLCAGCTSFSLAHKASDNKYYCSECVELLLTSGLAQMYRNTRHGQNSHVWQVNYESFTTDDLRKTLKEHQRLPLINTSAEAVLSFMVLNPQASWRDIGRQFNRSHWTVKEIFHNAIHLFQARREHPNFRPNIRRGRATFGQIRTNIEKKSSHVVLP